MTSQLVIFRAFLFILFHPPDPRSEKNSCKSTNKKKSGLSSIAFMPQSFSHRFTSEPLYELLVPLRSINREY